MYVKFYTKKIRKKNGQMMFSEFVGNSLFILNKHKVFTSIKDDFCVESPSCFTDVVKYKKGKINLN